MELTIQQTDELGKMLIEYRTVDTPKERRLVRAKLEAWITDYAESEVKKISLNLPVMRSVCCNEELIRFKTYGYDECVGCGKTYKHTDA